MASGSARRRKHKQIEHILSQQKRSRPVLINHLLVNWQAEARRRAKRLGAPRVWRLATNSQNRAICSQLDPTGEMLADLHCICAEAIAEVVDRRMFPVCPPLSKT